MKNKFKDKTKEAKESEVEKVTRISENTLKIKAKDNFEKHGCEFKNEKDCEEELEDEGKEMFDEEKEHYEDEDELYEEAEVASKKEK